MRKTPICAPNWGLGSSRRDDPGAGERFRGPFGTVRGSVKREAQMTMITDPPPAGRPRRFRYTPSPAARRFGYALAVLINALLLFLVNVWPGWQVLPFLTEGMAEILPWINASLTVGIVANLVNVIFDRAWLRAIGDLASTGVGLVALVQLWAVFPFTFGDSTFPWEMVVRTFLVVAIAGSAIGIVAAVVTFVRALLRKPDPAVPPPRP